MCGMCCNGVMFHNVRLQGADSAGTLSELGLRTKRKKGMRILLQPCPAHKNASCAIYENRPERCRIFECKQLQRVKAGEIAEEDAVRKISEAWTRVRGIEAILENAGELNSRNPLSKRAENVLGDPADPVAEPQRAAMHSELSIAMRGLEEFLEKDFRVK